MNFFRNIKILLLFIKESTHIISQRISRSKSILSNSSNAIELETYDGSGQVVHPCVIDFKNEHGIEKWAGYRYWMVITPYPNGNDSFENPCLYASDDGLSWIIPKGINNPLDSAPGGLDKGFNNDPDMIYNPDDDKLWIYYRYADHDALKVNLIRINQDMVCNDSINVIKQSPWNAEINKHRSLCIWRESSDRWHMWGGGGTFKPPFKIYYFNSSDGIRWGQPQLCSSWYNMDPFMMFGLYNWHLSCKPNYRENRVEFLCYAKETYNRLHNVKNKILRIFPVNIKSSKNVLVYAECNMNNPTIFYTPIKKYILSTPVRGWDNGHIYRASFQIVDEGDKYLYKLWYSAVSSDGKWGLGYTKGYLNTKYSGKSVYEKINFIE